MSSFTKQASKLHYWKLRSQNDLLINMGEELLVEVAKKLETFYLSFGYNKIKGSGLKESIHTANPLTPKSPQTNRLPEVRIRNGAEGGL